MMLLQTIRQKAYLSIFLAASLTMLLAYPVIQTSGLANVDLWFKVITPVNFLLYVAFSVTFGLLVSLQIARLRGPKVCSAARTAGTGGAGSILGIAVLQCPGCVSLISAFLPLNATIVLSAFNTWLTLGSIALMLLSIRWLGGFRK